LLYETNPKEVVLDPPKTTHKLPVALYSLQTPAAVATALFDVNGKPLIELIDVIAVKFLKMNSTIPIINSQFV
jgi:hypothetical protein